MGNFFALTWSIFAGPVIYVPIMPLAVNSPGVGNTHTHMADMINF